MSTWRRLPRWRGSTPPGWRRCATSGRARWPSVWTRPKGVRPSRWPSSTPWPNGCKSAKRTICGSPSMSGPPSTTRGREPGADGQGPPKVSGCSRSLAGAQWFCAVRSHVATAAKHGIGMFDAPVQLAQGQCWMPETVRAFPKTPEQLLLGELSRQVEVVSATIFVTRAK